MKLYEEFKLYENMWESADNNRFAKISYNGDAKTAAERSRFPLQFNTTKQMMADLNSQNGYRGWRLVNVIEGNTVVRCLVKLDKDNKILDKAPSNINLDDVKAINDYINSNTTTDKNDLVETVSAPSYSGNLRAYAYYGGTPKNKRNFSTTSPDMSYTDPDNLISDGSDDYVFKGTLDAWIKKLNKIAKHHQIVQLAIADEHEHEVFYAADTDPETFEEYADVRVFKNEIFKEYEPFMKQFVTPDNDVSIMREAMARQYYVELRAYNKDTLDEYDDSDNYAHTSEYGYCGTKEDVINKLNQIAKTCDFSFVFIYEGDPYDNNCVFEASDTNVTTDEEFDSPVIWKNHFTTSAPFMNSFIKA